MNINQCPSCRERAITSVKQISGEKNYITCSSCSASLNHSRFKLAFPSFIGLVCIFASIPIVREYSETIQLASVSTIFFLTVVATCVFVPMEVINPENYNSNQSFKPGKAEPIEWYQSPLPYIALLVILYVLYKAFT
jgi:hypothetical protein